MREAIATAVGFLIVPIIPGLAFGLGTPVTATGPDLITVLGLLPVGYFFSAVATVVFGVPLFLLGKHLKLIRWWSAIVAAFAVGILVEIVVNLERLDYLYRQVMSGDDRSLLFFGATGAISAFVFWLIWRQGEGRSPSQN
jgi:hypothetical protein